MNIVASICCLVYYVCSAVELIPSIVRIIKRRSSIDYSILSTLLGVIGTLAWSVYIYSSRQTTLVYLGTASDMFLVLIYTICIFKYHKEN